MLMFLVVASIGSADRVSRVTGPCSCLESTRFGGVVLIEPYTCALYTYVKGWIPIALVVCYVVA